MKPSQILNALRVVMDPEIGVNVVDLGLVYNVEVQDNCIYVALTMTTPTCPLGEMILDDAYVALRQAFPEAEDVRVDLVWNPPWSPERMTEAAKEQLGWK